MNIPVDTDAPSSFATGTGVSEPDRSKGILNIQPSWLADGYGLRGPQRPVAAEAAKPFDLSLTPDSAPRGSQAAQNAQENCDPGGGADTSLKYIKATQWDSGTSAWVCVWLPTCAGTCDA